MLVKYHQAFLEVKISSLIEKINGLWIMINTVET